MIEITYSLLVWLIAIDVTTSILAVWAFTRASKHLRDAAYQKARADYALSLLDQVQNGIHLTGEQCAEVEEMRRAAD